MSVPATVFVVDPDESLRDSLRQMAEEMGVPCEGYDSGEDFLAAYKEGRPGCLVAEFRLLGISGVELQETLAADCISLPILFVTRVADMRLTVRAMQNGALTVLGKPVSRQDLWHALRKAVARSKEIHFTAAAHQKTRARFAKLSRHERNVLPFVLAAMSNKKIAKQLEMSKRTVKVARRKIFKKTRTDTVAELLQMTREAKINSDRPIEVPSSMGRDVSQQLQEMPDKRREMLTHASRTPMQELVGGIVHEISQPLQAIANFSDAIESAVRQEQSLDINDVREWNRMISKASKLATEIIGRFRSVVSEPKDNRLDESLEEIVRESILMLQFVAQDRHVNVRFEPNEVTARVDRAKIQQVVINLLKNAIESVSESPAHDRAVSVKIISNAASAEIIVSDNGSGISESELPGIFEPFLSSKDDGLGLGLATSKSIVESHGGHIWYEPNNPKGAAFHVRLPFSR